MKQKTLVILKPSCVMRGLVGEVTNRFEKKGLRLAGMKMCQLTDAQLNEHYAHLAGKLFFQGLKDLMMCSPNRLLLRRRRCNCSCTYTNGRNQRSSSRSGHYPRRLLYVKPNEYRSRKRLS